MRSHEATRGLMETRWLEQSEADLPANGEWLSPEEAAVLGRMRIEKRRADWKLGRWTAKRAAAACLNLPGDLHTLCGIEVRPAPSGVPELFLANRPAGFTISISHRAGIAACAIATGDVALGCDLELIEPRDASFVADYFTEAEQALVAHRPQQERPALVTLIWSAKESALKALREGLRIDTRSLAVTLPNHEDATGTPPPWQSLQVAYSGGGVLQGWWQQANQMVRTLVGAPAPLPPLFLKGCAVSAGE